jgi:hypothetical protein
LFFVAEVAWWAAIGVVDMSNEFPLLTREHHDGMYSVLVYTVAKVHTYLGATVRTHTLVRRPLPCCPCTRRRYCLWPLAISWSASIQSRRHFLCCVLFVCWSNSVAVSVGVHSVKHREHFQLHSAPCTRRCRRRMPCTCVGRMHTYSAQFT